MYSRFLLLVVALFVSAPIAQASSPHPRPLKRVAHPSDVRLEILPRSTSSGSILRRNAAPNTLQSDDSLRITLTAYSDIFHLHLKPNDDLIHPTARIKYLKNVGNRSVVDSIVPLVRENILVYGGSVIHDEYTQRFRDEDIAGGVVRPYGTVATGDRGWARIMVLDAGDPEAGRPPLFEGAFSVDGDIHHIMTKDSYLRTKLPVDPQPLDSQLVLFRDSDLHPHAGEGSTTGIPSARPPPSCAHDRLAHNVDKDHPVLRQGAGLDRPAADAWYDPLGLLSPNERHGNETLVRRQGNDVNTGSGPSPISNFVDSIGQTNGCPSTQQIVYMGVMADCTYTQQNGGNTGATQQILRNFNTVSLLYKSTFNISLGIIELQISDPECPLSDAANPWNVPCGAVSLNERLSLFSAWRGQQFERLGDPSQDITGLWHLMSGCPSGTEVGVAWLGTVCTQSASGNAPSIVSGTAVSTGGRTEWQVVAHEIGHNFGAVHDCADGCTLNDDCCPMSRDTCNSNAQFLMSPVSSANERIFSPCTIGNICSLMLGQNIDTSCINPPNAAQRTFSLQMCGNGIVEEGEECDPGAGSDSRCCDPDTCRFREGSLCDPASSPCCTDTCQFAPSTQVCRPSKDDRCDQPETCSGTSSICPDDATSPNGQGCGNDGLACANGICTSISQQCRIVGASLGLRNACPNQSDTSCQVSCEDPNNRNQCIVLSSQLIDGSPCGFGGSCIAGNCQSGNFLQTAIAWYKQNLQISIPVSVVAGILVISIVWYIIGRLCGCCKRKKPKKEAEFIRPIPDSVPAERIPSWPPLTQPRPSTATSGASRRQSPPTNRFLPPPFEPPREDRSSQRDIRPPRQPRQPQQPRATRQAAEPQYPLPPSYGAESLRQSTWVDDTQWNGPRR